MRVEAKKVEDGFLIPFNESLPQIKGDKILLDIEMIDPDQFAEGYVIVDKKVEFRESNQTDAWEMSTGGYKMFEDEITMRLKDLPSILKKDVLDYVNSLLAKEQVHPGSIKGFKFQWENGLKGEKIGLNSVDLQHKSMEWR